LALVAVDEDGRETFSSQVVEEVFAAVLIVIEYDSLLELKAL
jgi:hypothetical protein